MPTLSMVKNMMRRSVRELLGPRPTPNQENEIWAFFAFRCTYCDKEIARERREGHIDHADPAAGNHLGNLILACSICNGDEKREQHWELFLQAKCQDATLFSERKEKILLWQKAHPIAEAKPLSLEVEAAVERTEEAMAQFEAAFKALRSLVRSNKASG
jgi:hypothetical protein